MMGGDGAGNSNLVSERYVFTPFSSSSSSLQIVSFLRSLSTQEQIIDSRRSSCESRIPCE